MTKLQRFVMDSNGICLIKNFIKTHTLANDKIELLMKFQRIMLFWPKAPLETMEYNI